ncbi:MAG: HAD family hydrolase [Pseudomonadales bacterium]
MRAVLFDLDNTLTHRSQSIECFCRAFVQDFAAQLIEPPSPAMLGTRLIQIDNQGLGHPDNSHPTIRASIAAALHCELMWADPPSFEHLLDYWTNGFPACAVTMPGATELLQTLSARGYRLAVLSNGAQQTRQATIEALGFERFFECVLSSQALGVAKPDPAIFTLAAERLNLLPSECCYVGDNPENDYFAPISAQMQAFWLEGFYTVTGQMPVQTLRELSQLASYTPPLAVQAATHQARE